MRTETVPSETLQASERAEPIEAFLDLFRRRRSIRTGFLKDRPVADELIEQILEAGRWAPSAGNSQPWEFIVIRNLEARERIVDIFKTQMPDKIEIEEAARGQRRRVNSGVDFRHAPVHILVLGDPRTNDAYPMRTKLDKWEAHFFSSLANCVLQMLLAAEVLGLSSMYISDVASPYFSVMLRSLLGIPEPLQIYHLLPVGFAKPSPTINHPPRQLEEMVHHERYDLSKFRSEVELQEFMKTISIRGIAYSF
jgi:nitroreductase